MRKEQVAENSEFIYCFDKQTYFYSQMHTNSLTILHQLKSKPKFNISSALDYYKMIMLYPTQLTNFNFKNFRVKTYHQNLKTFI